MLSFTLIIDLLLYMCGCESESLYSSRCHARPGSRFYGPVPSGVYLPSTWDTTSSPQTRGPFYLSIWMTFSSSTSPWYGLSIPHLKKRLTYWWCDLPLRWIFKWYNIIIILQNGLASSLPPLARFLASLGGGHISDLLISRETFSITVVRKIFMTTGKIVKLKKLKYTISLSTMTYLGL